MTRIMSLAAGLVFLASTVHANPRKRVIGLEFHPMLTGAALASGQGISYYQFDLHLRAGAFTLGPTFTTLGVDRAATATEPAVKISGLSFGGRVTWWMSGAGLHNSWVITTFYNVLTVSGEATLTEPTTGLPTTGTGSVKVPHFGALFGYNWNLGGFMGGLRAGALFIDPPESLTVNGTVTEPATQLQYTTSQTYNLTNRTELVLLPYIEFTAGIAF